MPAPDRPLVDPQAFSQLYDHAHLIVFRFIYALHGGPRQEVEDLTAETFIRAWKARHRFQGDEDAAVGWLLHIARNLVIDAYRRERSQGESVFMEDISLHLELSDRQAGPEEEAIQREQFQRLWGRLHELPAEHREMLVLRYSLGWQVKRIASHMDMLENTVSVNLRRIIARLRRDWPEE